MEAVITLCGFALVACFFGLLTYTRATRTMQYCYGNLLHELSERSPGILEDDLSDVLANHRTMLVANGLETPEHLRKFYESKLRS